MPLGAAAGADVLATDWGLCMRRLVAITATIALAGCNPPIVLKTITLNPSGVYWADQSDLLTSGACNIPLPGQGLDSGGLGPATVNPGEAPSGYDDIFYPGAQPIPCNEQEQILYRGDVQFDLSKFAAIVSATLNFSGIRSTLNHQPQTPPACVATVLGLASAPSQGNNGPYFWNYSDSIQMTPQNPCQTLIPPLYSFNVSSWARQWTGGSVPNNGMIIAGPDLGSPGTPQDNNGNVSFYSGFQLVVLYNPALNPQAPQ
jgi:hypothetical protein